MGASIVMPYRDLGCDYRNRARDFTLAYWQHNLPDLTIVVADPDPFTRARGLNAAVREAHGDVLFACNTDCIVAPPDAVSRALELAAYADGLVLCHTRFLYLTEEATDLLLEAGPRVKVADFGFDRRDCHDFGTTGVDIACFSRATWEEAGGYEERFGIWGGDDAAFALACETLVAPNRRVDGDWIHLWHPRLPQSSPGGPGYVDQFSILKEYVTAAEEGPAAMRALISAR